MTGLLSIGGVLQNAQGLINNSKVSVDGGAKFQQRELIVTGMT